MSYTLRVLVVDDEEPMRKFLGRDLRRRGHDVWTACAGEEAIASASAQTFDVMVLDLGLPDLDGLDVFARLKEREGAPPMVVVITASGDAARAVKAMKMGAHDYVLKPFEAETIGLIVDRGAEVFALKSELAELRRAESARLGGLVGKSAAMASVLEQIQLVAASPSTTVLVDGETGTGKELVARAIHEASSRRGRPFVAVNCSAIQESLLESELFGYEPGAFTDAKGSKKGLFEVADGGTVLLDEIGDMDPKLQAKVLRVLEERTLRRLGGTRDIKVDLRVIAATNRDLPAEIEAGRFRRDLFYRLNVVPIHLAPLRARAQDIPLLAAAFLDRVGRELGRSDARLTDAAVEVMAQYAWPGNVRELRNLIERLLILHPGGAIDVSNLPAEIRGARPDSGGSPLPALYADAKRLVLSRFDESYLRSLLHAAEGNVSEAARRAGLDRGSLQRLMRRTGLSPSSFRR